MEPTRRNSLDVVHRVIQVLFDCPEDESAVTLAQLLVREKDKLEYTFDFGDDWQHTITLEKILGLIESRELPRCTGGRGLAPREDSGGLWGWMDLVDAINDPTHERHMEQVEWTGIQGGLDASAFDADEVNRRLGGLHRM